MNTIWRDLVRSHSWIKPLMLVLVGISIFGCRSVDPTRQMEAVRSLDQSRTGNELVWEISEDDKQLIVERIEQAMQEGIDRNEASAIAVLNNRRLQSGYEQLGLAAADIKQAGAISNPSVSGAILFPTRLGASAISIMTTLSDLWIIPQRKRTAKIRSHVVELQVASMVLQTSQSAMLAWDDVVASHQRLALESELLSIHQEMKKRIAILFKHGLADTVEVETFDMLLLDEQIIVNNCQAEIIRASQNFDFWLSYKDASEKVQQSELTVLGESDVLDLSQSLETAMRMRLDLMAAKSVIDLASRQLKLEKALIWNRVEIGIDYEGDFRSFNQGENDNALGPSFSVEIPIFNQNQGGIATSRYQIREAIKNYASLQLQIRNEVISQFSLLQATKSNLRILQNNYTDADERELEYVKKWNMKMQVSYMNVLDSSAKSLNLKIRILEEKQIYNRRRMMLEQVILDGFPNRN